MAILKKDSILAMLGVRGKIGGVVIKQYGKKVVVSSLPDRRKVKPTKLQKAGRKKFAAAVAYAKSIMEDPKLRKKYERKLKPGERLYQFAMREFFAMDHSR